MNQEKIDELTADLAQALVLIDKVRNAAYAEHDSYKYTRRYAHRAVHSVEHLLDQLQAEWAADERNRDLRC